MYRSQISHLWPYFTRLRKNIWKGVRGGPAPRISCMRVPQNCNCRRFPRHTALPFSSKNVRNRVEHCVPHLVPQWNMVENTVPHLNVWNTTCGTRCSTYHGMHLVEHDCGTHCLQHCSSARQLPTSCLQSERGERMRNTLWNTTSTVSSTLAGLSCGT